MRKIWFIILAFGLSLNGYSQSLYDETLDANKQLDEAISKAKEQNKYVLAQVGGNWCRWCIAFNDFVHSNDSINEILTSNFVFVHLNFSPKNKNEEAMKRMENPQRFGFPVLVVFDDTGRRIHTQNSAYLEDDKSYSVKRVTEFLKQWSKSACEGN
ncbi:MAG: thioredoxin family protein [Bacteroidales bacterium]|jgi:thioredoxin-related protein|nr:thioredoxin family protein [Bacteroidales bacterium]